MDALILSYAFDTNGQNARYVKASAKWGTDEGVLKALALGKYDPAAVVRRFQAAADKTENLRIRSAHHSEHLYQSMPADIVWDRASDRQVRQLALEADIIHLNNSWRPWQRLNLRELVNGRFRKIEKPLLLHHHGSLFRQDPKGMLSKARQLGAVQAVSTVDLMRASPSLLHWLPTAYDVDWLVEFGNEHRRPPDGRIRVVSAPTNRMWKSTETLEAAVATLQAEGLPIDLLLIENRPWAECMALKATADIYFDQVKLGYGCNAIEAWGMGIPVIAGADEWTLTKMREVYGSASLPFYEATEETVADAIRALMTKRTRTTYANRGMRHIRTFHDERPALTRLAELYGMAMNQAIGAERVRAPVTFTALYQQVHIASRYLNFPYTTDNPYLADRIRAHGVRYPRFGIEEVA